MAQEDDALLDLLNTHALSPSADQVISSSSKRSKHEAIGQATKKARRSQVSPSPAPKPPPSKARAQQQSGKLPRPNFALREGNIALKKPKDVYDADSAEPLAVNRNPLKITSKPRSRAAHSNLTDATTARGISTSKSAISSPTSERPHDEASSPGGQLPRPKKLSAGASIKEKPARENVDGGGKSGNNAFDVSDEVSSGEKEQAPPPVHEDTNNKSLEPLTPRSGRKNGPTRNGEPRRNKPPGRLSAVIRDRNEDSEAEEDAMTFGKRTNWANILEALNNIRRSPIDKDILTKDVKKLKPRIKALYELYKQIHQRRRESRPVEDFESKIAPATEQVADILDSIAQKEVKHRTAELMQDIYVIVASTLVILLKWAMKCRVQPSAKIPYTAAGLEEVVEIQNMALSFLEKVVGWNVKPHTDFPIISPVKQRILPYLRSMNKEFRRELEVISRREKIRRNAQKYAAIAVSDAEDSEMERERRILAKQENIDRMMEGFASEKKRWRRQGSTHRSARPVPLSFRPGPRQTEARVEWAEEEDRALCDELLNNLDTRFLPGKFWLSVSFHGTTAMADMSHSRRAIPEGLEPTSTAEQITGAYQGASFVPQRCVD